MPATTTEYVLKRDRAVQARRSNVTADTVAFVVRYRLTDRIVQSEPMTFAEARERRDILVAAGLELDDDGYRVFNGIGPADGYAKADIHHVEKGFANPDWYLHKKMAGLFEKFCNAVEYGNDALSTATTIDACELLASVPSGPRREALRKIWFEGGQA